MKDCLFCVADGTMAAVLEGFFSRDKFYASLGCSPFSVDLKKDIVVARSQCDPGVFKRAYDFLAMYRGKYRHAVVILDAEWEGSPGPQAIQAKMEEHLRAAGWPPPEGLAVVIVPELEAWLWTNSVHSAQVLGWGALPDLREALRDSGQWPQEASKPPRPKEAVKWALRSGPKRLPHSSSLYRQLASRASLKTCRDQALKSLAYALRQWFPKQ
jgi:hypothetical protein